MAHKLTSHVLWGEQTYAPGSSIPGLTDAQEAGLVSSNRAEWVGAPSTTQSAGVPLVGTTNLLTGGIKSYSGDIALPGPYKSRTPGNTLTRSFYGRLASYPNGADHTTHIQAAMEAPFKAIRFHLLNPIAAALTGVRIKFSVNSGVAGDSGSNQARAPSGGSWLSALVGGSATWTAPAGVDAHDIAVSSTDIYVVDSADRTDGTGYDNPLVWARVLIPASNANRPGFYDYSLGVDPVWQVEGDCSGRIWRPLTQAVDGVTSVLANLTSGASVDYTCVPLVIETFTEVPALNIAVFGNSINDKAGDADRVGWQDEIKHALSTQARPIEFATFAVGGSNSSQCYSRMAKILASQRFDFAVFPGINVNDLNQPITPTNLETSMYNLRRCVELCRQYGVQPIITTATPANTAGSSGKTYGSSDVYRQMGNDFVRQMTHAIIMDQAAATEGVDDGAGQIEYASGYSTDGLHPASPGKAAIVNRETATFNDVVSVNF